MLMSLSIRLSMLVGVMALVCLAGGCGCTSKMKTFDIAVEVAPGLHSQTVVVDISGVSIANDNDWNNVPLNAYWATSDPAKFRESHRSQNLVHTMEFRAGESVHTATLSKSDPMWNTWKTQNAMWLYIVAEAGASQYRKKLTLDSCTWDTKTNTLNIMITPSGIQPQQSPLPEKR
ncbi:MAG: hypothetical protein ACR2GY_10605 [Phycisphaerales bacterium]